MQNYLHIGGAKDGLLFPAVDDAEVAPGFDLYIRDSLSAGDVSERARKPASASRGMASMVSSAARRISGSGSSTSSTSRLNCSWARGANAPRAASILTSRETSLRRNMSSRGVRSPASMNDLSTEVGSVVIGTDSSRHDRSGLSERSSCRPVQRVGAGRIVSHGHDNFTRGLQLETLAAFKAIPSNRLTIDSHRNPAS